MGNCTIHASLFNPCTVNWQGRVVLFLKSKKITSFYVQSAYVETYVVSVALKLCRGLGCSSVVQRLPSMQQLPSIHEALGSIPAPKKKRQRKKKLCRGIKLPKKTL
jgi:hypothetical protein